MSLFQNNTVSQSSSALLNGSNRTANSINNGTKPFHSPNSSPVLEEGKIIKGEIIDIHNNEVTIKLEDNQTITAPLKGGSELAIGQTVSFEVVADSQKGMALRPLTENLPPALDNTLNKALEAAGLPKNIKNMELVKELLANQMSIDKQSLQSMLRQSLLHKDVRISTLVLMVKYQIPMTQVNAAQLENYRNYEHRIAKEIDSISSSLPNIFNNLAASSDSNQLNAFHNQLITTLLSGAPSSQVSETSLVLSQEAATELLALLRNYPISDKMQEELLLGKGNLKEVMDLITTDFSLAAQEDEAALMQLMLQDEADTQQLSQTQNNFKTPLMDNIREQFTDMLRNQGKIGAYLSLEDRQQILLTLKDIPLPDSILKTIQSGNITTKELLSLIKSYLPLLGETAEKELLSGSIYKSLVKEQLLSNWALTPKALTAANALPDLYERMDWQLAELERLTSGIKNSDLLLNAQNSGSKPSADMNGLRQNIDFMKTLNDLFTYVQIPVRLKDKTIHSDLYVYTNQKELKKNKNNISILLHLDMDFLGSLDIHVNLNYNQITSKFYLETTESADIVKDNIIQLEDALSKKGFLFQYEILKREKQTDVIQEFIKKDAPMTSLKRYSFDIRA